MVYTTSKHTSFLLLLLLFFFIFYFYFFDFIFKLYNIVLVLPNIEMNTPQVTSFLIKVSLSIVALQCCVSFCYVRAC